MATKIENDYLLHNDNELTRLALQHVIIKDATKGKLVFAPIRFDVPLSILDACTGDGLWIRDLQASIAPNDVHHSYTGTDIEGSYFPKDIPKNTNYHIQDITKPWPADWNAQFDLVHQRLALVVPGSDDKTLEVLRNYVNLLKPGRGWMQLVEVRNWTGENNCHAFKDLTICLSDMIKTIGASLEHIEKAKGWLETLGLVDIQEEIVVANYGTREDKKVQDIAKRAILTTADSILGVTSTFPQQLLRLPRERVLRIKDDLEKEFEADLISAHWQYKIVWGRKPE